MTLKDIQLLLRNVKQNTKVAINDLVTLLKICDIVYYNDAEGIPSALANYIENTISDEMYDDLVELLKDTSPSHPYLKKIGAPVKNAQARKMKLPFHMGSLDKIKPDTASLTKFLNKGGPFVVSDKVDGISLGILPKEKLLITRGDGSSGQNISHLLGTLPIPTNVTKDIKIRAEIVMPIKSFQSFSKENSSAKNPRNTVSGLVNKASKDKAFAKTKVLCYQILGKKPSDAFKQLKALGYNVPFYMVYNNLTSDMLEELLVERKKRAPYEIDGLVVSRDVAEVTTSGNPKNSVAFKSANVETTKQFKVIDVSWQPSKHGYLKPVLIFEPQELDGVTVKRATAFNAKFIKDNSIGKGSLVEIRRSGGVIPFITKVIKKSKQPLMPAEDYEWNETNVDISLTNSKNNDTVKILKLTNFLKSIGIDRVKQGMVTILFNAGINTVKKLLRVSKTKLLQIDGIQDKTASMIFNQIQEARKNIQLPSLLFGSGCFPRTLGTKRLEVVINAFPKFLTMSDSKLLSSISALSGFNTKTAEDFVTGLQLFKKFYANIEDLITIAPVKKQKIRSSKLSGKQFVFTGVRDKDLEALIAENGGKVASSVTKDTTILVVKDLNSSSSKAAKANDLGIKIMTLPKFSKWIEKYV